MVGVMIKASFFLIEKPYSSIMIGFDWAVFLALGWSRGSLQGSGFDNTDICEQGR